MTLWDSANISPPLRNDAPILVAASRESSLHPEHDPSSASYSGRKGPGPTHGDDPHGPDPHDEVHDSDLPANQQKLPAKEEQDKYYKGGLHVPD